MILFGKDIQQRNHAAVATVDVADDPMSRLREWHRRIHQQSHCDSCPSPCQRSEQSEEFAAGFIRGFWDLPAITRFAVTDGDQGSLFLNQIQSRMGGVSSRSRRVRPRPSLAEAPRRMSTIASPSAQVARALLVFSAPSRAWTRSSILRLTERERDPQVLGNGGLRLRAVQDCADARAWSSLASKDPVTTNSNRSLRKVMKVGSVDTTAAAGWGT